MQDAIIAAVPVLGAVVLAVGGGLVHMSRKIEAMAVELRNLREDVQTMEQRIYEMLRDLAS